MTGPLFLRLDYDVAAFPFQPLLARLFGVRQLDRLHEAWSKQTGRERLTYADNLKLRRLMQRLPDESPFYRLYNRWILSILAPYYARKISYSAHPKMRVHLSGTGCVSDFHCDADVTGRDDQINCYLPFTDARDGGTLWCERRYGSEDYAPLDVRYGEAIVWDGGRLRHGTFANETGATRVSCDFRFSMLEPDRVAPPWRDVLSRRP